MGWLYEKQHFKAMNRQRGQEKGAFIYEQSRKSFSGKIYVPEIQGKRDL